MDVRKEAKRRARLKLEEFMASGEFQLADFRESLFQEFADLANEALIGLVDWAAEVIDREAAEAKPNPTQKFPACQWDIEGIYRLGNGRRIAKELALKDHIRLYLEINDKNAWAVNKANIQAHEEFEKLEPFLTEGITKAQAIAAYEEENPPEERK